MDYSVEPARSLFKRITKHANAPICGTRCGGVSSIRTAAAKIVSQRWLSELEVDYCSASVRNAATTEQMQTIYSAADAFEAMGRTPRTIAEFQSMLYAACGKAGAGL
jgi:hypothetical protein